jgi:phage terminase large subunit-like protein
MNIPVSKENTLLKEEQILYFETSPESFDMIVMGVDPAISEKASSDFTGITII